MNTKPLFKRLWQVLRIIVAIGLLIWLGRRVNLHQLSSGLGTAKGGFLLLALFSYILYFLIATFRWRLISITQKLSYPFKTLLSIYSTAFLFNNILPTAMGGDVIRLAYTQEKGKRSIALSVVVVDRIMGMIGLFFLAFFSSLFLFLKSGESGFLIPILIGFLVALTSALALFFYPVYQFLSKGIKKIKVFDLGERLGRAYYEINKYRKEPKILIIAFLLSLGVQISVALAWYFIGCSTGGDVNILWYFLYIPVITVIAMIPITLGGLGLRETSFFGLFTGAGLLTSTQSITTATLNLGIIIIFCIIGGIFFMILKRRKNESSTQKRP